MPSILRLRPRRKLFLRLRVSWKLLRKKQSQILHLTSNHYTIPWLCVDLHNTFRKVETKKKQIERLQEQLQKLELQATDKVSLVP